MNIKSVKYIGKRETYSPEMRGEQHNYLTGTSNVVHKNSHSTAYVVVAQRCLYLKAHFPAEWWASVMSICDQEKLAKYVNFAKLDGVNFGPLNINKPSINFTVDGKTISPGLGTIKNMDTKLAMRITMNDNKFVGLDDFVEFIGKSKIACERLIKLGAFDFENPNRKALWYWYQYKYGTDEQSRVVRKQLKSAYKWPQKAINDEINRQINEFKNINPNKKIPPKILNWVPKTPYKVDNVVLPEIIDEKEYKQIQKIELSKDDVLKAAVNGFQLDEILKFEKEYLGYCCHSPMELFSYDKENSIALAKTTGILDVYIDKFSIRKKNTEFGELSVTDGNETARVMIWGSELTSNGVDIFEAGNGIRIRVKWNDKFKSFNMKSGSIVVPLQRRTNVFTY
jgi:DNA polymerase III alpha subunit